MKLVDKCIKPAIIKMFKAVQENTNIMRKEMNLKRTKSGTAQN